MIGHRVKGQSLVQTFAKNAMRILTNQLHGKIRLGRVRENETFLRQHLLQTQEPPYLQEDEQRGLSPLLHIARDVVQTNWMNHYCVPFMKRQKQHIRLHGFNGDRRHTYDMQMLIWKGLDGHKPLLPFQEGGERSR